MTVDEMLHRMSAREMAEWRRFAELEPFGGDVDDFRAGLGPAVEINIHRKEDAAVVTPYDLIPWRTAKPKAPERDPTPEEVARDIGGLFDTIGNAGSAS